MLRLITVTALFLLSGWAHAEKADLIDVYLQALDADPRIKMARKECIVSCFEIWRIMTCLRVILGSMHRGLGGLVVGELAVSWSLRDGHGLPRGKDHPLVWTVSHVDFVCIPMAICISTFGGPTMVNSSVMPIIWNWPNKDGFRGTEGVYVCVCVYA